MLLIQNSVEKVLYAVLLILANDDYGPSGRLESKAKLLVIDIEINILDRTAVRNEVIDWTTV